MSFLERLLHFFADNILGAALYFFKLDNKRCVFNSTGNSNYNFNSKFLFEYISSTQGDKLNCYFVVNDELKRRQLLKAGIKNVITSKSFNDKVFILLSKCWVCSTIEAPVSCLIKNHQRIVYHLGHGIPLKNIGMAEKNISLLRKLNRILKLRLFTHVTCYSDYFKDVLYKAFNKNSKISYMNLGQPRNDSILNSKNNKEYNIKELCLQFFTEDEFARSRKVLYCPTWRNYGVTKFFPFKDFNAAELNDYLETNNIIIFTREHPYYNFDFPVVLNENRRIIKLNSNVISDITPYLQYFDCLITDYSSIFIDYILTEKPIYFIPYDYERYKKEVGFSKPYPEIAVGKNIENFSEFLDCINDYSFKGHDTNYLKKLNLKSSGNCLEHYKMIISLTACD